MQLFWYVFQVELCSNLCTQFLFYTTQHVRHGSLIFQNHSPHLTSTSIGDLLSSGEVSKFTFRTLSNQCQFNLQHNLLPWKCLPMLDNVCAISHFPHLPPPPPTSRREHAWVLKFQLCYLLSMIHCSPILVNFLLKNIKTYIHKGCTEYHEGRRTTVWGS